MASYGFHKRFYNFLAFPFKVFLRRKFRFTVPPQPELPEHFLMISNHVTNYDPFIAGIVLRKHMYFVATEHIFSLGWKSKCIKTLVDPIPRPKGGNAAGAVMEILRRLKDGKSVGLFAEGNTSWDGRTIPVPEATGKMVRSSRAPLVTFRIKGGYFAYPRWAYSFRRGPVTGEVVHIYSPEELRAMTPEEINRHIAEDIGEDAYVTQEAAPAAYPGKALSKGIEHALVICPKCHGIDRIRSNAEGFFCSCGLKGSYDAYGYLSGEGFDFTDMRAWEDWQKDYIRSLAPSEDRELTRDDGMELLEISGHSRTPRGSGSLGLSSRSFSACGHSWPLTEVVSMEVRLHGILSFSLKDGSYFEVKKADGSNYSGRKYRLLWEHFRPE